MVALLTVGGLGLTSPEMVPDRLLRMVVDNPKDQAPGPTIPRPPLKSVPNIASP